jgi:beta-lactamase class A
MPVTMTRRTALAGSLLAAPWFVVGGAPAAGGGNARLAELERRGGGRLGVALLDVASGTRVGHRADERFAMCSTFKFLAVAAVLGRVDREEEHLERRIVFAETDIVPYSPVTKDHVGAHGMTLSDICEAALTQSDNTAGNLLLASLGGPAGLTAYARSLGDQITRLDRIETDLNEATPGDLRDTTTPAAMLENLRQIALGDVLSRRSRERLTTWLIANKTGDKRLRAGLPADWRVGDKTGAGGNGATNDIAVIWPPGRGPIVVTAYFAESPASPDDRNIVLAQVGRLIAENA